MQQISSVEDLMREHGVLYRLLLIYKRVIDLIKSQSVSAPEYIYTSLWNASNITKQFIEDYHQALERDYIFPVLRQYKQYVDLVDTLLEQHKAAECITDSILAILGSSNLDKSEYLHQLVILLSDYIEMYEPHSAREDTVIFPAFHQLAPPDTFRELGEKFEEIEEQKFGKNGFERILGQVAQIEKTLNIHDLSQFTVKCSPPQNTSKLDSSLHDLLKDGGYILYSRHGEANVGVDLPNIDFNNCNTQRNLSKNGRREAIEYGNRLRSLHVPISFPMIASPFCRTIETAVLAFGRQNVTIDPFWYHVYRLSGSLSVHEQSKILKEMQSRLEKRPPQKENTVIIAHGLPNGISFGPIDDMGTVIIRPLGEGNGYEVAGKLQLRDII